MTRNMRLPADVREEVSRTILARATEMGWDDLTLSERSEVYSQWIDDAEIGGKLTHYLPRERIRVWIKDGPMKEFSRAKRGLGSLANYVDQPSQLESTLATRLLGPSWQVRHDSIRVKPARFIASDGTTDVTILWGPTKDLKHLVWAWLNASSASETRIAVIETSREPVTADEGTNHERIASRLGTEITHVRV